MDNIVRINTAVAREHGEYAGVLYAYLAAEQAKYQRAGDKLNTRLNKKWIPGLSYEAMAVELPIFPDVKTIKRAAAKLLKAELVLAETSGVFLEENRRTGRKRDIATWWHVVKQHSGLPAEVFNPSSFMDIFRSDVEQHGISYALILAYFATRAAALDGKKLFGGYRKLSPAEMAKVLPAKPRALAEQLEKMVKAGLLVRHASQKKFYERGKNQAVEPKEEYPAQPQQEPESIDEAERAHAAKLKARFAKR